MNASSAHSPPGSDSLRQHAPPGGGKGCGRSCLFGCLGAGGLAVLLMAAVVVIGWSELQRTLPEWRERYPWLDAGIELAGLLRSPELIAVVGGREEGLNDPSLLPPDIPMLSDALLETYSVGGNRLTAFQRLDRSLPEVLAHWTSRMPAQGWSKELEREFPEGRFQIWLKGDRSCRVEVATRYGQTEVWLRCSWRPDPPE